MLRSLWSSWSHLLRFLPFWTAGPGRSGPVPVAVRWSSGEPVALTYCPDALSSDVFVLDPLRTFIAILLSVVSKLLYDENILKYLKTSYIMRKSAKYSIGTKSVPLSLQKKDKLSVIHYASKNQKDKEQRTKHQDSTLWCHGFLLPTSNNDKIIICL